MKSDITSLHVPKIPHPHNHYESLENCNCNSTATQQHVKVWVMWNLSHYPLELWGCSREATVAKSWRRSGRSPSFLGQWPWKLTRCTVWCDEVSQHGVMSCIAWWRWSSPDYMAILFFWVALAKSIYIKKNKKTSKNNIWFHKAMWCRACRMVGHLGCLPCWPPTGWNASAGSDGARLNLGHFEHQSEIGELKNMSAWTLDLD